MDRRAEVAAVQSYQWHVLNKSESWLTEAVRTEYAGSYMVERPFQEALGSLKMIAGTAYMIRADLLRALGWGRSLTEDWELTLRLYAAGYKVVYTPYAETPAECVSTFSRFARQRMRWAEGHTFNVRKHFLEIVRSPNLNLTEKVEFLFYSNYYLQAALWLVGNISWLLSEIVFKVHVPEWTAVMGWSLLFTNTLALPLMNISGLTLEAAPRKDYSGVIGAFALSFLVVPFQAYAAFKGLFEKNEGPWFRTPKTGHITDPISHLKGLLKLRKWLFGPKRTPGNGKPHHIAPTQPPVAPSSARRLGWVAAGAMSLALIGVGIGAVNAPVVEAAGTAFYLHSGTCPSTNGTLNSTSPAGATSATWALGTASQACKWATTSSTTGSQIIVASDVFTFTFWASNSHSGSQTAAISAVFGYSSASTCTTVTTIASMPSFSFTLASLAGATQEIAPTFSPASNITVPTGSFFCWTITVATANTNISFLWDATTTTTNLNSSQTIFIPELLLALVGLGIIIPLAARSRLRLPLKSHRGYRT